MSRRLAIGASVLLAVTLASARGAQAGPSPVDELLARCPTADEVAAIDTQVPFTFDADPTSGTFVCTARAGSANLTRLGERAYQALLAMQSMTFRQPLPWTDNPSLYDWFSHAVHGVRFRSDIANSFCCDPAYVINIANGTAASYQPSRWVDPSGTAGEKGLVDVLVHEARHAEGPLHTCPSGNDATFGEMGAWAVEYYLNLWEALYGGPFLAAPDPYEAYYRDWGVWLADDIAETRICAAPSSDLSVSIDAAPDPVPRGGTLTYAITVRNGGPQGSPATFLYSAIPPGGILISSLGETGSCIGPAGGRNGSVGCSLGPLGAGASTHVTLVFRVIAPQTQAVISNRELSFAVGTHVSGLVHDAVPANNTFGVTTTLTNSPPIVTTLAVTGVGETTATLAGTVNPHGVDTTYHFEYGASSAYGTSTPVRNAGSGTADLPVAEPLSGLPRGTTFHYRLVATSGSGTTTGADATFRTQFQCIVPAVKRKSLRAAKRALRRAHCAPGRVRRVRSRVRRGLVISQRPHPGARLREGGRVNLVVSLGRKR